MSDNTKDFGLFIDGLRLDRKMSRDDLIEDIVSLSQYKRYLRGSTPIPNTILVQLADRLKFSLTGLYRMFETKQDLQNKKIMEIYSTMRSNKLDEAYKKAQDMRREVIISDYNTLFFDYCFIFIQHSLSMVSDVHALGMYSELIDYPLCKDNETFNWVEINILLEIVKVSARIENYEPSQHMYEIVTSPTFRFITAGQSSFIPTVFAKITPVLGKQEKHEEVINLANEGISYCKRHQVSAGLATLLISKAFALSEMNRIEDAINAAKKALMQFYLEDNERSYRFYLDRLAAALEIPQEELDICK